MDYLDLVGEGDLDGVGDLHGGRTLRAKGTLLMSGTGSSCRASVLASIELKVWACWLMLLLEEVAV